jgi:hypothetical protein
VDVVGAHGGACFAQIGGRDMMLPAVGSVNLLGSWLGHSEECGRGEPAFCVNYRHQFRDRAAARDQGAAWGYRWVAGSATEVTKMCSRYQRSSLMDSRMSSRARWTPFLRGG